MKKFIIIFFCLLLWGCQTSLDQASAPENAPPTTAPPAHSGELQSFSFPIPGGPANAEIQVDAQGQIQLGDGSWKTVFDGTRVKVFEGEQLVATVHQKEAGRWDVDDPQGNRLAKVKLREDGDFKVVDSQETMLVKLKKRDGGYKVVDSDEETTLLKVSAKDERIKVKDGQERELAKIKGTSNTLLITWMSIAKLPLATRMAMATITWGDTP